MRRYIKAAEIINAIRHPVPCVVAAQMAMAVLLIEWWYPDTSEAAMRLAAKGPDKRSGYAGNTHVGVIM